ncbi:MAG: dihydroorotase, partial [Microbacterium sp. 13-71-7]
EAKACEWQAAANGMVGLESALRVVHQSMVQTGLLDWTDVARVMSSAPARIGSLPGHGTPIAAGQPAEFTLYDADAVGVFAESDLHGQSTNSPYLGRDLPGKVLWTVHHGYTTLEDGVLAERGARS